MVYNDFPWNCYTANLLEFMLNEITEINYEWRVFKACWFKNAIAKKWASRGMAKLVFFMKIFVLKDPCTSEMKHLNNMFRLLELPGYELPCGIFLQELVSVFSDSGLNRAWNY